MDACCGQSGQTDDVCGLNDDPTLAACCLRDLKEQAYVSRVKATLLQHDHTDARSKLAQVVLAQHVVPAAAFEIDRDSLVTDSDEDNRGELLDYHMDHRCTHHDIMSVRCD